MAEDLSLMASPEDLASQPLHLWPRRLVQHCSACLVCFPAGPPHNAAHVAKHVWAISFGTGGYPEELVKDS
jgi:hypothetical protein